MKRQPLELPDLVVEYFAAREEGVEAHRLADKLMDEIASQMMPGQIVSVAGIRVELVDTFAAPIIYRRQTVRRFELKVLKPDRRRRFVDPNQAVLFAQ